MEAHIRPDHVGLVEGGEALPDEDLVQAGKGFSWAPGALDGAFGHHGGGGTAKQVAAAVLRALRTLTQKATSKNAAALYATLCKHATLEYIDPLLAAVMGDERLKPERLHAIAQWLVTHAPDREPVKVGVALLGLFRAEEDRDLLLTLGRHEEFTLYVAVALSNVEERHERTLWQLAQHVTGWGRIQIIERLAGTQDEHIRAWLLREGYRNDIMVEYTALICATTGDLLSALRLPEPDDALLRGAGEILSALIHGRAGPAEGIGEYSQGAETAELYLEHLQNREATLEQFLVVSTIKQFLEEELGEAHDPNLEWHQRLEKMQGLARSILSRSDWTERVWAGLASNDADTFNTAATAARVLDIDIWEIYFERLERGESHHWYFVLQTDDPTRIDRVITLAEERLPLELIATGPADELGLGPVFQHHSALDFVLQALRHFPGRGWPLIRAGLQSPVTRNRNMAIRALSAWDKRLWPAETKLVLRTALEREPNGGTQEAMRKVLAGEELEY
ncbi:MAG: hypothetical protein ACRC3F_13760 [Billgrantia desiderata]